MLLLDGKAFAKEREEILKGVVTALPVKPKLAIVQIGDNAASDLYVGRKESFGKKIGIEVDVLKLPGDVSTQAVQEKIQSLNDDQMIQGIIVQLPIPESIDREAVINTISPDKDIDGLTAVNMWRLMDNARGIVPATAKGIEMLLDEYAIDFVGKHAVIVGDSLLVGKPVGIQFLNRDATVTICHSKTKELAKFTKQADILVVAAGKPNLISHFHVKLGQIVVDVGISKNTDGSVVGDVDLEAVKDTVGAITPVPGGVGPMTVLSIFENLIDVVKNK